MKCELIRQLSRRNPEFDSVEANKANASGRPYLVPAIVPLPIGTIIDHPDAWRLVLNGDSKPADEECQEVIDYQYSKKGLTYEEGHKYAVIARERLDKGIHPDHFDAFDEGRMTGYDVKGRTIKDGEVVELPEDEPDDQYVILINPNEGE